MTNLEVFMTLPGALSIATLVIGLLTLIMAAFGFGFFRQKSIVIIAVLLLIAGGALTGMALDLWTIPGLDPALFEIAPAEAP